MTIIGTRSGTSHEEVSAVHDWVRRTQEDLATARFPDAPAHSEEEADNNQVRIAVTDRGSTRQRNDIERLLDSEDVIIEWVAVEHMNLIRLGLHMIDGIILTAREQQGLTDAWRLNQGLLEENFDGSCSVPLFAMGESVVELLEELGGSIHPMRFVSNVKTHQIDFAPGSQLRTWAGADQAWISADYLTEPILPSDDLGIIVNATVHDPPQFIQGFEMWRQGKLQMGTLFDLVDLALRAPTEDAARAAWNIIQGFVAEVREQATN